MAANINECIIDLLLEDIMFIKLYELHLWGSICLNNKLNESCSVYLRAMYIAIIVTCTAATNHGWLLFKVWSLTK